jgi:hypothetical protein
MRYLIFLLLLTSCEKDGLITTRTANQNFYVDFLFEIEGVKVWRFSDGGRYHYFTSKGETISSQKQIRMVGKQSYIKHYDENINSEE